MSYRDRFLAAVETMLGKPVLWGAKGPDAFDCSGLVTYCVKWIGGVDLTEVDNAQGLHDQTRLIGSSGKNEALLPGDLVLYGLAGPTDIIHVAVYDEYGGVISADGATPHITSLPVALANPANRVRRHNTIRYRGDCKYIAVHRNVFVDRLDLVER